jgi:hypothetical protein
MRGERISCSLFEEAQLAGVEFGAIEFRELGTVFSDDQNFIDQ